MRGLMGKASDEDERSFFSEVPIRPAAKARPAPAEKPGYLGHRDRLRERFASAGPDALPALYDPVLVAMSPQAFTLMGFERIEGAEYAQSWLVAPP